MREHLNKIDHHAGGSRSLARLAHVLGADKPVENPSSTREFLRDIGASRPRDVEDGWKTVVGAGVGYFAGQKYKHPLLGAIAGGSLANNLPALFNPGLRDPATRNLVSTGAGLAAAYYAKDHKWYVQVLAFIGGRIAGSIAGSAAGLFE